MQVRKKRIAKKNVNKRLLSKALEEGGMSESKEIKYSKDVLIPLLDKYSRCSMYEMYYCCAGAEKNCWVEPIEEGVWGFTLEQVKEHIKRTIRVSRGYLYNSRVYGGNRMYKQEMDGMVEYYIYLRDILGVDYHIILEDCE